MRIPRHDEDSEVRGDISCNRIIACEVQTASSRKLCHFEFKTQIKELLNTFDVLKMFTLDFNERQTEEKPLSLEDRKFLKIVPDGIYQLNDSRYEMPLPLKTENLELPDNKEMALSED